jgi:S1-C subfamily serine protease
MADTFKQFSQAMAQATQAVGASLVRVEGRRRSPATGIVWSADTIVTANHVVELEENIVIGLPNGETAHAKLVGRDPQNDLAVLKVEGGAMQSATWGDDNALMVGSLALAVARPNHNLQASLGLISALVAASKSEGGKKRGRRGMGQMFADGFIRTDLTMYPGFSGGALIVGDNAIYGMVTSGYRGDIAIAIPVTTIKHTVATLLAHGKMKQGFLGVGVQPVRLQGAIAEKVGQEVALLVMSIEKDSPAERASFLVGDILTALDGETLESVDDLLLTLQGERVGKEVHARLVRGGEAITVPVTIGERE